MYTYNISVSQAIREIITSNGLYLHAIRSGIANYTALAQKIKPEVDKLTSMPINVGTIAVAIKRFADTLQFEQKPVNDCMNGARMSLTGSIIDIDFHRQFYQLANIIDEAFEKESGYNLFQSNNQLRLFAEDVEHIRKIVTPISKKFDGKIKDGLSRITITLPSSTDGIRDPYNILPLISDVLYNNQIPIHNAFFAPNEIILILNNKYAARAYEMLRTKITK